MMNASAAVWIEPRQAFSPARSFCLFVFVWLLMMMTFSLPGRGGSDSITSLDWVSVLKLGTRGAALAVLSAMFLSHWQDSRHREVLPRLVPLSLYVLWAVLSAAWSSNKTLTIGQASGLVVLWLLAVQVAAYCRSEDELSRVLFQTCASLLAFCGLVLGASLVGYGELSRGESLGIVHPTTAAATASLGLLTSLTCWLMFDWRWTSKLVWPSLAVHTPVLFMASSRTSILMTGVLVAVASIGCARKTVVSATLVILSVLATLYLTIDPGWNAVESVLGHGSSYIQRGNASDLEDFSGRREMWEVIWESHQDSVWLGHGFFMSAASGEVFVWQTWANWSAHNVVLQALVSTGRIGAGLLILGLCVPVCSIVLRARDQSQRRLCFLVLIIAAWFSGWGLFSSSFLGPLEPESVVLFVILGVAAASISKGR